ncbi:MAG: hypothetical protein AB2L24_04455 [Mangrovibacterium sp.]
MKSQIIISCLIFFFFISYPASSKEIKKEVKEGRFKIGWAGTDITPDKPALIAGQFHARVSEGIMDSITATVLAFESEKGSSSEKAILISCDLISIRDGTRDGATANLRDEVRNLLKVSLPELKPEQIILNATHTHTAPLCSSTTDLKSVYGVELDAMSPYECQKYISERIAKAAEKAWKNRKSGGISFGLGFAVVGHNRLAVDQSGKSAMYGKTNTPGFSHLEGYEDHSVNLLYTWDKESNLTGVVINIACPSQVTENLYKISADYWHETRLEVRQRLGKDVYILPQCSAAGDQSPHIMAGEKAETRMQRLMFPGSIETGDRSVAHRKQIAIRIADAVTSVFPYMKDNIEWNPAFIHRTERVGLSRRLVSIEDVNDALKEAENWKTKYDQQLKEIQENPAMKGNPRWYADITRTFTQMKRGNRVKEQYESEKAQPKMPVEVHVIRIGDAVMATNPFELYVDYGMRIKARSPAVQTFLVQLAGSGTYVPTTRSIAGGAYGAVPASTLIGPEGGQELVEETLKLINSVWNNN